MVIHNDWIERAIREACREVAQSLGFNTSVADSAEHAYRLLDWVYTAMGSPLAELICTAS